MLLLNKIDETNYLYKYSDVLVVVFFAGIICLPQYYDANGLILNGGDFTWPYDFERFLSLTLSTWDDSFGYGNPASRQHASLLYAWLGYLLSKFGLAQWHVQQIFFIASVVTCLFSSIYLGKLFGWSKVQSYAFAILYSMSSISLNYWSPEHGLNIFAYYWLPILLLSGVNFIVSGKAIYLLLFFFISQNPSFSNPVFFVEYAGLLVFFLLFFSRIIALQYNQNGLLVKKALLLALFIIANIHWISTFIVELSYQFNSSSNELAGLYSDRYIAIQDSINILYAIMGNGGGIWTASANVSPDEPLRLWGSFIRSPIFLMSNVLVVVFSLVAIINKKNINKSWVIFFGGYIVVVAMIAGLKSPLPIYIFPDTFLDIPGVERAFRSMFLKIGFVLAFFWAIIASYSVKGNFWIATVIFVFLLAVPHFTSTVNYVTHTENKAPNYAIPPDAYNKLRGYSHVKEGKLPSVLAVLPINRNSYNIQLRWSNDMGYSGSEFLRTYWYGPLINTYYGSRMGAQIQEYCLSGAIEGCLSYLQGQGVSYFLIRKDHLIKTQERRKYIELLGNYVDNNLLELIEDNPFYSLYSSKNVRVNNHYFHSFCTTNEEYNRINASIFYFNPLCNDSLVIKHGNHVGKWLLCQDGNYKKRIFSSKLFGLLESSDSGFVNYFMDKLGCSISENYTKFFSEFNLKNNNSNLLVYFPYTIFLLALIIQCLSLVVILLLSIVELTKTKFYRFNSNVYKI